MNVIYLGSLSIRFWNMTVEICVHSTSGALLMSGEKVWCAVMVVFRPLVLYHSNFDKPCPHKAHSVILRHTWAWVIKMLKHSKTSNLQPAVCFHKRSTHV